MISLFEYRRHNPRPSGMNGHQYDIESKREWIKHTIWQLRIDNRDGNIEIILDILEEMNEND